MSAEYEKKLEERIHRELAKLPERAAPEGLSRSVLQAIDARKALPWWRKSFANWPRGGQAAFLTFASGAVALAMFGVWQLWPAEVIAALPNQAANAVEPIRPFWSAFESLGRAAIQIAKAMGHPVLLGVAGGMFVLYTACAGMGLAWLRLGIQHEPLLKRA